MLYFLEDDILSNLDSDAVRALENIAGCINSGYHIILANRRLLKALSEMDILSDIDRRIFLRRYSEMTQYGGILSQIHTYVRVSGGRKSISVDRNGREIIYHIPLEKLKDSKNLQPTNLVCEDISDCEFYRGLTLFRKGKYDYNSDIFFNNINGGGRTTGRNYKDKLETSISPCLTIVDSDKNEPGAEVGETAKEVEKVYEEFRDKSITEKFVLRVREKENLIPPKVYCNIVRDQKIKDDFEILVKICDSDISEIYFFLDVKNGHLCKASDIERYVLYQISQQPDQISADDLRDLRPIFAEYLGPDNPLTQIAEKLRKLPPGKENVIYGTRDAFKIFESEILKGKLREDIERKKVKYRMNNSPRLKAHIDSLEKRFYMLVTSVENSVNGEFELYWRQLVRLCYEWGCGVKISVS